MSCKWGSEYVWIGSDQTLPIELDENARFITEVPEWKQSHDSYEQSIIAIPPSSLEVVTTGTLRGLYRAEKSVCTIGCSFGITSRIELSKDNFATAQLWDTAGQERFRTIGRAYYRGADMCILVYDISRCDNVGNIMRWMEEFRANGNTTTRIVLFGNKLDLADRRTIKAEEVREFAEKNDIYWIEVSAKSGENLERAFARLFSEAYMLFWSQNKEFKSLKIIILGDSGIGKTTIFDRLADYHVNLAPLVKLYPILDQKKKEEVKEKSWFWEEIERSSSGQKRKKIVKVPNTNVISLNLGLLSAWVDKCEVATGDPEFCFTCGAAFTLYDKIYTTDTSFWICDYCKTQNKINIENEEIPKTNTVDYLQRGTPSASTTLAEDNSLVVFCIDTSGSMTTTSPLNEKDSKNVRLKTTSKNEIPTITAQDAQLQYLPNEKRGIKYISRLEAVQQAIETQLIDLQQEHPDRGVVLVTFSNDVTIYGDGLHEPRVIAGDRLVSTEYIENLSNWWKNVPTKSDETDPLQNSSSLTEEQKLLLSNARTQQEVLKILSEAKPAPQASEVLASSVEINPIIKSRLALSKKLFSLEEEGQTALGPGLLASCAIASVRPGSKVVLCTDGIANIGVGAMDSNTKESIREFYRTISDKSIKNNTTISLMGFKGSDSNIEVLGEMATKTGGQVDIVDPAEVNKNLQNIFSDDTVARDILVNLYLPNGFVLSKYAIELDEWVCTQNKSGNGKIYAKKIGSINSDSNLLLPFELDPNYHDKPQSNVSFQLQVKYTRIEDGKTLLRVCSRLLPTTLDRNVADNSTDLELMGLHAIRHTAQIAQTGNYTSARLQNYAYLHLMKRLVGFSKDKQNAAEILKKYITHNTKFEKRIYLEQTREISQSKEWDDAEPAPEQPASGGSGWGMLSSFTSLFYTPEQMQERQKTQFRQQRENRTDDVSNLLWNMRGANMI